MKVFALFYDFECSWAKDRDNFISVFTNKEKVEQCMTDMEKSILESYPDASLIEFAVRSVLCDSFVSENVYFKTIRTSVEGLRTVSEYGEISHA